jgi:hypothetical protein
MSKTFYYPHIDNETIVMLCEQHLRNAPRGRLRNSVIRIRDMFTSWSAEEIAAASPKNVTLVEEA